MESEGSLVRSLPDVASAPALRAAIASRARLLARVAFAGAIVLGPFRAGLVLVSRPQPPLYSGYTDFVLPASEAALLAALGCWLVSLLAGPRPLSLGPAFLRLPVAGLVALVWIGVPFSIDQALSAFDAVQLLMMVAVAVYVLNEIESVTDLAVPIALMVAIQAGVGLAQLLSQHSLGLGWLDELRLDPAQNGVSVVAGAGATRLLRAYGLTDHPNILGGLLAFALPVLAFGGARAEARLAGVQPARGRRVGAGSVRRGTARAIVPAAVAGLGVAGLFATFSRTAWLAAAAAAAVGLVVTARAAGTGGLQATLLRHWRPIAAAGALVAVLLVAYAPYVGFRTGIAGGPSVTEEMSVGERSILAADAATIAAGNPLTGTGIGTLPLAIERTDPGLTFDSQPAHVVLLDVAAEAGLLAAFAYVVVLVAPWLALWRRRGGWTPELAAASAALAAVTVAGLFDYYTWTFPAGRFFAWLVLGTWAGAYVRSQGALPDAG